MKKRVLAAGAGILAAAVIMLFWTRSNDRNDGVLELSGTVEVTEVNLGFKTAGRVASLAVDEGRTVRAGDRLAVLDRAEFESIVDQNRAAVKRAEAELDRASKDHERAANLAQGDVISPQQLDAAAQYYAVSLAQLEQARAALRTSVVRLNDTVLLSTANGVVLERNAEPGETVAPGQTVLTIGELDRPWIKVYVKETKLGLVQLGQKARISADTYPGSVYDGTVTFISSEAEFTPKNVQTREERVKLVFGVKVTVMNRNSELKPGMPADVRIIVP